MRIQVFQHVPFEGIGSMEQDFAARGFAVTTTHWYLGDAAPNAGDIDALIVMGGPMGVHDDEIYPWLAAEKQAIKTAIGAGKIVIGICLGAQLIADVLGAPVTRNAFKEIGWWPLHIPADVMEHPIARTLAENPKVFHWHGDTFANPSGALRIAFSEGCANQAFALNDKIFGFQFHLETTPTSAQALIQNCGDDIDGSRYTQAANSILKDATEFETINRTMSKVLAFIFGPAI